MLSDVTGEHTGGLPSTTWPLLIGSTSKTATPLAPAETTSLVLHVELHCHEPGGADREGDFLHQSHRAAVCAH